MGEVAPIRSNDQLSFEGMPLERYVISLKSVKNYPFPEGPANKGKLVQGTWSGVVEEITHKDFNADGRTVFGRLHIVRVDDVTVTHVPEYQAE